MKITGCLLLLLLVSRFAAAQEGGVDASSTDSSHAFRLTSSAFKNNTTMPLSAINNIVGTNGLNSCTADGSAGGDQSPELSWEHASPRTVTFVVTVYDTTAAFTHWGMYNIPATTTELPENAGVSGSTFGAQVFNDFFAGAEYDGPCPPAGVKPFVHRYVFTVYALDVKLHLPSSANFPASAETLYQALITAGRNHHILQSASITGLFSATPPQ